MKELLEKFEQIHKLDEEVSKLIYNLRDGSKDRLHKIIRDEKEIEVREYDLWEEVRNNAKTNALEKLKELYPEQMEQILLHNNLITETNAYLGDGYGVYPHEMRLSKLIMFFRDLIKHENGFLNKVNL